jgi:hypothetical protein
MSNYIKKHNDYLIVVRTVLVAALTNYNELETKDKDVLSEFNDFFIKLSKYYGNKRRIEETVYDGLLESSTILNKIKKYKTDMEMLIDKNDYIIYKINKKKEYYISEIMEYINKIKEYFAKYQMTGGDGGDEYIIQNKSLIEEMFNIIADQNTQIVTFLYKIKNNISKDDITNTLKSFNVGTYNLENEISQIKLHIEKYNKIILDIHKIDESDIMYVELNNNKEALYIQIKDILINILIFKGINAQQIISRNVRGIIQRKQFTPLLQQQRKQKNKKAEIVELIKKIKPTIYNKIELQQLPTNELHKMLLDLIQYYNKLKLLDDELHAI